MAINLVRHRIEVGMSPVISVPFAEYSRSKPLVLSFVPRSHGECACANTRDVGGGQGEGRVLGHLDALAGRREKLGLILAVQLHLSPNFSRRRSTRPPTTPIVTISASAHPARTHPFNP
jgi:hypothetical protein